MNMQHDPHCLTTFSFRSVVVGALVAFGLLFLFNLFTVAWGLAAYTKTEKGLESLIFFAYLWTLIGSFVLFFISGTIATMVACRNNMIMGSCRSILYGFVTWVLYILLSLAIFTQAKEISVVAYPKHFVTMSGETTTAATSSAATPSDRAKATEKNKAEISALPPESAVRKIGLATLATFFIFFIEVVGCCFGAWWAADWCRRKC